MRQAWTEVLEPGDDGPIAGEDVMDTLVFRPDETVYFKALIYMD